MNNQPVELMKNKRLAIILAFIALVLLVPLTAMQFTEEVNWSPADFLVMGILLLVTGLLCELVMRKVRKSRTRLFICAGVVFMFVLVWIELAVGLFGTPFSGS